MTEDTPEIKPCPFCKGIDLDYIEDGTGRSAGDGAIWCYDCGCTGPMCHGEHKAIKAWNEAKR